ncbi:DUF4064 domain-containing protein [Lentibacillus sp. N15]|uniref:DUF4064 domain-containing protein n=1 Tax=Lentibacillus songyuanensis TaxID=3136161 RepID=UPI0031BA9F87
MKRIPEMIVGIVAISIDGLIWIAGTIMMTIISSNPTFIDEIGIPFFDDIGKALYMFIQLFWIPIISCLISFILGLIGVFNVYKRPTLAGSFFIAATVISSWLLFTVGAFQCLIYLVAGVLCFVRKPESISFVEKKID